MQAGLQSFTDKKKINANYLIISKINHIDRFSVSQFKENVAEINLFVFLFFTQLLGRLSPQCLSLTASSRLYCFSTAL